jgi:hypothetical protein
MMDRKDIETLGVKLGMLAAGLNDLCDRLTAQSDQATQQVTRSAQSIASSAGIAAQQATTRLESTAASAIAAGTRNAMQDMERTLLDSSNRLVITTSTLEERVRSLHRLHATTTWKAFLASGIAAFTTVAVVCVLTWQMLGHLKDVAWFDEVQRARAIGTLQPCPEGGVCVYVNKRWHRLAH